MFFSINTPLYGIGSGNFKSSLSRLFAYIIFELEQKTNIKVSTYDPGPINSALRSSAFPGENKKIINTAKVAAKNFINFMEDSYES